jgi:hypothetical protein
LGDQERHQACRGEYEPWRLNIIYVVAAGNDNYNACFYSPADVPAAITVGAIDAGDWRSSYSNYGTCVDIFAPGSRIVSAYNTSDNAYEYLWGTSMASPHVAGVAATYLSTRPAATPAQVTAALVNSSTTGRLSAIDVGSPNRLLYNGFTTTSPPFVCTDAMLNGDFESGLTAWQEESLLGWPLICDYNTCGAYARTGAFEAWLGGLDDEVSTITQRLTVPAGAGAMLSYWYYVASSEGGCSFDFGRVQVRSGGNVVRDLVIPLCSAYDDGDWHNNSIDLSDLAGKTIDVIFSATTDFSNTSSLHIDDVRIRSGPSCAVAWSDDEPLPNSVEKGAPAAAKSR